MSVGEIMRCQRIESADEKKKIGCDGRDERSRSFFEFLIIYEVIYIACLM